MPEVIGLMRSIGAAVVEIFVFVLAALGLVLMWTIGAYVNGERR